MVVSLTAQFLQKHPPLKRPNCVHHVFYLSPSSVSVSLLQKYAVNIFRQGILNFPRQRLSHDLSKRFHLTSLALSIINLTFKAIFGIHIAKYLNDI